MLLTSMYFLFYIYLYIYEMLYYWYFIITYHSLINFDFIIKLFLVFIEKIYIRYVCSSFHPEVW